MLGRRRRKVQLPAGWHMPYLGTSNKWPDSTFRTRTFPRLLSRVHYISDKCASGLVLPRINRMNMGGSIDSRILVLIKNDRFWDRAALAPLPSCKRITSRRMQNPCGALHPASGPLAPACRPVRECACCLMPASPSLLFDVVICLLLARTIPQPRHRTLGQRAGQSGRARGALYSQVQVSNITARDTRGCARRSSPDTGRHPRA